MKFHIQTDMDNFDQNSFDIGGDTDPPEKTTARFLNEKFYDDDYNIIVSAEADVAKQLGVWSLPVDKVLFGKADNLVGTDIKHAVLDTSMRGIGLP